MKKIMILMLAFLSVNTFAQEIKVPSSLTVMESTYILDGVERNGFDILLQGEEKAIINAWAKYISDKFDLKLKTKGSTASGAEFNNTIWSDK